MKSAYFSEGSRADSVVLVKLLIRNTRQFLLIKTPESAIQLDRRIHSKTSSRLSPALSSITSFESRMAPSPPTSEEGNVSLLVSFLSFSKVLGKTRS